MKIRSGLIFLSILIFLFGGVYGSKAIGLWDYQPANSSGSTTKSILAGQDIDGLEASHTELTSEEETHIESDLETTGEIHEEGAIEVMGETTLSLTLEWGLTVADIEAVIGGDITEAELAEGTITIKELAEANGISFGKVKTALNLKLSELSQ